MAKRGIAISSGAPWCPVARSDAAASEAPMDASSVERIVRSARPGSVSTPTTAGHHGGPAARGEPRWPASAAVAAILALYWMLPIQLTIGPTWLVSALELVLVVPLSAAAPRRAPHEPRWQRIVSVVLIALANLINVGSLGVLVGVLLGGTAPLPPRHLALDGRTLVLAASDIWLTNVLVFALWYWELDRGGPDERSGSGRRAPDFLFPQLVAPHSARTDWSPTFTDYLYVSVTNAAAFSPADTLPLTRRAKALMGIQALASLLTLALVAARAVNILR